MEKITLSLSDNYLSHWTVKDALRELYQNVLDREVEDPQAIKFIAVQEHPEGGLKIFLGNYKSDLTKRTLLLGETTKANDSKTIGKFGEGYKLAILVLLRNGINVVIETNTEIWTASLEYNEQFEANILTISIDNKTNCNSSIRFVLKNVPIDVWEDYKKYNLHLQDDYTFVETKHCEVLKDNCNRGKIFIGGLYVCEYMGTSLYGYNFDPSVFSLGRDRNIINGFDTNWEASQALVQATIDDVDVLNRVLENTNAGGDTNYIHSFSKASSIFINAMWDKFIKEYPNCIPVNNEWERARLLKKYVNIEFATVTLKELEILTSSKGYKKLIQSYSKRPPEPTPIEIINQFYDDYSNDMPDTLKAHYAEQLMTNAVNWQVIE